MRIVQHPLLPGLAAGTQLLISPVTRIMITILYHPKRIALYHTYIIYLYHYISPYINWRHEFDSERLVFTRLVF